MQEDEVTVLTSFLLEPLHTANGVLSRFSGLPGAVDAGDSPERFVYVPGSRSNRVVRVAHADTVWYGSKRVTSSLAFNGDDGYFYSDSIRYGLGADDRAGCAILWLMRLTGHSLLITDGEEQGLLGTESLLSWYPELSEELNSHQFMVQFDRGNGRDFKCYDVGTQSFRRYVAEKTGYTEPNRHSRTDIVALCQQIAGVNLSVGYRNEHTPDERLYLGEWLHTLGVCRQWLNEPYLPRFVRQDETI